VDESGFDGTDPSYQMFRQRTPAYSLTLPIVVLLVVVAIVSGLVFGGVIQGDESRVGPERTPTTPSTVLIVP
jgi:hypothetical protein